MDTSESLRESILARAEAWAASLWESARDRWPERTGQDRSYRLHVVHPAVRAVVREFFPEGGIRVLDLGCGDGAFLDNQENRAMLDGGSYMGVDISSELIRKARETHDGPDAAFLEGNLADPETAADIMERGVAWDCFLSVFVIQEMADIHAFLANLAGVSPRGSLVIVVTVGPSFAGWLRDEGHMPAEDSLGGDSDAGESSWRWAGYYPIVDEPREPFYLPYFHRTADDYRRAFKDAGFTVREIRQIPSAVDLHRLRNLGVSPFIPFETNLYWPRIAEDSSAVVITAVREADHD